nr:DNA-directed DNA polymerase [Tanacetum cinerariifolium]
MIKSLLTNKDKLFELAKVPLNENCSAMLLKKLPEKLGDPDKFLIPCDFPRIYIRSRSKIPLILGRSFLRTGRALIDVYGEEITLLFNDEFVTFNLNQTMRYSSTYDDNYVNRVYVIDIACEEFVQDVLDFQYNSKSSNPTLVSNPSFSKETKSEFSKEPIVKSSSPILTPFGEKPPELELKELPSYLEYDFLEETDKLLVIIAKDLKDVEKEALIKVLKSHKPVIAWKISDIKGTDPRFCTHKILMEKDYKAAVKSQRRVNPKIHDVIKKEVIKLLDAGRIYPISDSP